METHAEYQLPEVAENEDQIRRLELLLSILNSDDSGIWGGEKRRTAFGGALLELSRAFRKVDAAKPLFTMWSALYIWPSQVSQDYLDLLAEYHPAALLLLAHYCILLEPLESRWYMTGIRRRIVSRIYSQLDDYWRPWLQWPLEEVGLSRRTLSCVLKAQETGQGEG